VICGHVTRPYVCIMCRCQRLMQWTFRAGEHPRIIRREQSARPLSPGLIVGIISGAAALPVFLFYQIRVMAMLGTQFDVIIAGGIIRPPKD